MQFYTLKNERQQYYARRDHAKQWREEYVNDVLMAEIFHNKEQARIVAEANKLVLVQI
jgi:hypothetical protein